MGKLHHILLKNAKKCTELQSINVFNWNESALNFLLVCKNYLANFNPHSQNDFSHRWGGCCNGKLPISQDIYEPLAMLGM